MKLLITRNTIIHGAGKDGKNLAVGPNANGGKPQEMEFADNDIEAYRLIICKKAHVIEGDETKLRKKMTAKAQKALVGTEVRS